MMNILKKWMFCFAVLLGCAGTAYGEPLSNAALEDVRLVLTTSSYVITIKNFCEEYPDTLTCGDLTLEMTKKLDGSTLKLMGRTMNQKGITPSLFGFTASEAGTTYIVLIQEEIFLIIQDGEVLLEEKGKMS